MGKAALLACAAALAVAAVLTCTPAGDGLKAHLSPAARELRRLRAEKPIRGPAYGPVGKGSCRLAAAPSHPLDPLTWSEIEVVHGVLVEAGSIIPEQVMVHGVELNEPSKETVLAWSKGSPLPPREAYVNIWREGKIHNIIVDIDAKEVKSDDIYNGSGKPMLSTSDFAVASSAPLSYKPFLTALEKRNFPVLNAFCAPLTGGWYNQTSEEKRRICRVVCFDRQYVNYHMAPIQGLVVHVDLDRNEVYKMIDTGPAPNGPIRYTSYNPDKQVHPLDEPFKTISIEQPQGVNFKVDGYSIEWDKWSLHAAPHPRAGLIISRVSFNDTFTSTVRDIMYQGHLSEMFVPYQDPGEFFFFRTFMDVGEYGFGNLAMGLVPINDCPKNAHYIDAVLADPNGNPYVVPNMMCVFERYAGDVVWRHTEPFIEGAREVRPKVTLVARQAATVGNYDYTIDWEFQTDGLIRVTVHMSGMVTVKSTNPANLNEVQNADDLYGTFVSDHTVAVNHDHFINFRLDMDVDGAKNSFTEAKLEVVETPGSWRKSIWKVAPYTPKTELEAQFNASGMKPAEYFVVNKGSSTRLGNKRSYKIVPRMSSAPMNLEDDFPQLRAAWTKNSLYVTPYNAEEKWAGGLFPNQQHGDDTLSTWTEKNRSVDDEDIVVWYNLGYHHAPVQEDFPVMPSTLGSFDIKPANFFEANPAIKAVPFEDTEKSHCQASLQQKGTSSVYNL